MTDPESPRVVTHPEAPALACPRCHADISLRPAEIHQGRRLIRCECGHQTRVIRTPRAPEPRARPRMSKKDRRRARAALAADIERHHVGPQEVPRADNP